MQIAQSDVNNIRRELCNRSLAEFVKQAWSILDPAVPLVWGWHMDAVCDLLEAVTDGRITRALINVPPGTSKSSLVNIYWPAWEWGPKGRPHERIISAAHEQKLAIRDNRKMRMLVSSEWYQDNWPTLIVGDQNEKTYYETVATGFRQACAVKSMTGRRGTRIILDDPLSVSGALSDVTRVESNLVFDETLQTRLVDPSNSAIIVVMQRLHEDDVAGHILSNHDGYVHMCLPMEYEAERKCVIPEINFEDPRTEEGELLFYDRFPLDVVEGYKKSMGSLAYSGQMQQRPAPRAGGYFDWQKLQIVNVAPEITRYVRYWDKAGTQDGGAYTAGVKLGLGKDEKWYVVDVRRGQYNAPAREKLIRDTAEIDGHAVEVWIEQEPGSGGKESAESTIRNLAGFVCKCEKVSGSKEIRAEPYSVQVEAGNICVVASDWSQAFIDEHKTFPVGKYKDQVDAAAGAFNKLAVQRSWCC